MDFSPTTPHDYLSLRDELDAAGIHWCLVGGQAVNVWALHYLKRTPLLAGFSPFTSKDIDSLFIAPDHAEKVPELRITHWTGETAMAGVVGGRGEVLKFLPGLADRQWIDRIQRLDGWPIAPPDALFASKCWNFLNIPQAERQDMRHLLMLNQVLGPFLEETTGLKIPDTLRQIAADGTLKRVIELAGDDIASRVSSHVTISETPGPRFHVASNLYEKILRKFPDASDVVPLSLREEAWTSLLVQYVDLPQGLLEFEKYAGPVSEYVLEVTKGTS